MMTTTIDEVMATVTEARHRGPEALAALALCYGADAVRWEIRHCALRRELIDTKRGMDTAREERDAAREALAAKDSAPDLDYPARAEVWRLRESVAALQDERDRAVQEREDFGLRASAAVARAERAEKALADAAGVADRLGCRIVDLEAEVLCLQGERDRARAEIEEMRVELNSRVNEVNEARRLVRDLAEMTVSRDQLRDEAAMLRQRPTYEARAVAPTDAEWRGHLAAGGSWLVLRPTWVPLVVIDPDTYPGLLHTQRATWLPLGATGLPCAWPVVASE